MNYSLINFLLFFIILIPFIADAQVSAGNDNKTASGQITWNIGELVTEPMSNTQGSSEALLTVQEIELVTALSDTKTETTIFPNPVVDVLTVSLTEKLTVRLLNNSGVVIFEGLSDRIDMTDYASGAYILQINNTQNKHTKSYKIIKK